MHSYPPAPSLPATLHRTREWVRTNSLPDVLFRTRQQERLIYGTR